MWAKIRMRSKPTQALIISPYMYVRILYTNSPSYLRISGFVANLKMKDRWWYLCLVCFLTEIGGYQVPTFHEVLRNVTFVNGPPIPDPPPTLDLSRGRLLFPFMNFTCNGTIKRLTFLGWLNESGEPFDVTSWPYFSLWRPLQVET